MPTSKPKRPRDPNQLAKLVVDLATGETEPEPEPQKDEAAAQLARRRAKKLSPERRSEIARKAAKARWSSKS